MSQNLSSATVVISALRVKVCFFTNSGPSWFVITGKTTLADALVASNGIISQRMAGKVRRFENFSCTLCCFFTFQ